MTGNKKEIIFDHQTISRVTIVIFIIVHVLFIGLYLLLWGNKNIWSQLLDFAVWALWAFIPSIIVHEGLHGIIWAIPNHWKHIRFGFDFKLIGSLCPL